jgi:DNA-binding GntR family transcriptional regulator
MPGMAKPPRPRGPGPSLADRIHEALRDAILTGDLAPGSRVVELEIAATMGTSQGPVREALQRLAREGLVTRHARTSTLVTRVSTEEMHEVFETRALIETFAVRRLARTITPEQLHEAGAALERMKDAAARDDLLEMAKWDRVFHRGFCAWAGREALLGAWEPLFTQVQRFIVQHHRPYYASVLEIARGHEPILEALGARDEERATRAVREHIMDVWSRRAARPEPDADPVPDPAPGGPT